MEKTRTAAGDYQDLYIYLLKGLPKRSDESSLGRAFLGNWVEGDMSFLFFSRPSQEMIARLIEMRPGLEMIEAYHFTYEQLVDAYNQTRIDYVVPMPMNVARMKEYSRVYDIDLARSVVALEDNIMQGLGMLGVRDNRTWITRLGVLPVGRRKGVGRAIMEELLRQSLF